jgi:phosphoserine phosphatase RsbU/P
MILRQRATKIMDIEQPEWLLQVEDILETLNEGVLIADQCHQILFINSCMEKMLETPAAEIVGLQASQFYSQDEYKFLVTQIEESEREGQHRFEFVVPKRSGDRLPVIISTRRLEDPDGRTFAIVTFTDISEQKRAEARLVEANAMLEERHREIEADLALAARVQQTLAPRSMVWGGMRVEGYFNPVRTIGGDFGLVSPIGEQHLNLLICDVSGHGIGSALLANRIYTETQNQLRSGAPLGEVLSELNSFVMHNISSTTFFFTMAAARIDRGGRRMSYAGAGHPPAILTSPGRDPRLLESRSIVLGALPNAVGAEAAIDVDLQPGDRVVMYSDGITDVFNSRGEMLGVPGVSEFVREASLLPFAEMKQGILDRVAAWRDGPPSDDVSLVLLEVL